MKELDLKEILKQKYDITTTSLWRIKGVYKVQTEQKCYCLKIVNYNLSHFLFILGAINHLHENEFNGSPEIIKTVDGNQYIELDGKYAYLTSWLVGRECSYDNNLELYMAAIKLGELHNASKNFIVDDCMEPRIGWFKWIETYRTRKNEILDFKYKISEKQVKSEVDKKYMSLISEELERCDRSIENLCSSGYEKRMLRDIKVAGFCHHDYAHHNVLMCPDGVKIIDFDYCILDTYMHDLASILIRSMKYGRWNDERVKIVLRAYSSVHRIEVEDIPIMAAFMEFPQDFWQRGIQYYWEKKPWGDEFFLRKIRNYEDDIDERQEFINRFRKLDLNNI